MTQPDDAQGTLGGWFASLRRQVRGTPLLVLAMPFLGEALLELALGNLGETAAAAGAFALLLGAQARVRRGDRRAVSRGAVMAGVAALLVGAVNAGYGVGISVLFGLAAGFGTLLAYGPASGPVLPEYRLPEPAPPPPPDPDPGLGAAPVSDPDAQALASLDNRVTALAAAPLQLPGGEFSDKLVRITGEARSLLREAHDDPADFARVRRFLAIYLDQLETLVVRYRTAHPQGGALSPGLARVLDDLERAFAGKREELRLHDIRALDVEVEVLARRLAEQLAATPPGPQETRR